MKYILLLFIFFIFSCTPISEPTNTVKMQMPTYSIHIDDFMKITYNIIQIDGCEYIVFNAGTSYQNVIHKANCKNQH